jgi:hypothetical protein
LWLLLKVNSAAALELVDEQDAGNPVGCLDNKTQGKAGREVRSTALNLQTDSIRTPGTPS